MDENEIIRCATADNIKLEALVKRLTDELVQLKAKETHDMEGQCANPQLAYLLIVAMLALIGGVVAGAAGVMAYRRERSKRRVETSRKNRPC